LQDEWLRAPVKAEKLAGWKRTLGQAWNTQPRCKSSGTSMRV